MNQSRKRSSDYRAPDETPYPVVVLSVTTFELFVSEPFTDTAYTRIYILRPDCYKLIYNGCELANLGRRVQRTWNIACRLNRSVEVAIEIATFLSKAGVRRNRSLACCVTYSYRHLAE